VTRETEPLTLPLAALQPSQLWIHSGKLEAVRARGAPFDDPPLPVRRIRGKTTLTDGHTRAVAAFLEGADSVRAIRDEDDEDWGFYETCVAWCEEEGVLAVRDLAERIVEEDRFRALWIDRCAALRRKRAREKKAGDGEGSFPGKGI